MRAKPKRFPRTYPRPSVNRTNIQENVGVTKPNWEGMFIYGSATGLEGRDTHFCSEHFYFRTTSRSVNRQIKARDLGTPPVWL